MQKLCEYYQTCVIFCNQSMQVSILVNLLKISLLHDHQELQFVANDFSSLPLGGDWSWAFYSCTLGRTDRSLLTNKWNMYGLVPHGY